MERNEICGSVPKPRREFPRIARERKKKTKIKYIFLKGELLSEKCYTLQEIKYLLRTRSDTQGT